MGGDTLVQLNEVDVLNVVAEGEVRFDAGINDCDFYTFAPEGVVTGNSEEFEGGSSKAHNAVLSLYLCPGRNGDRVVVSKVIGVKSQGVEIGEIVVAQSHGTQDIDLP